MRAFGAEIVEHGTDFDDAKQRATELAEERGYEYVPSFHPDLIVGVATYAWELFHSHSDLDVVYAPIGLGSGICGLIRTRDLLGLKTDIVGVVSSLSNAYRLSFEAGRVVPINSASTFADGIAVRVPDPDAVAMIHSGAKAVIEVSDHEIAAAIRTYHEDTHNLAEGAGAAAFGGPSCRSRSLSSSQSCCDPERWQHRSTMGQSDPRRRNALDRLKVGALSKAATTSPPLRFDFLGPPSGSMLASVAAMLPNGLLRCSTSRRFV